MVIKDGFVEGMIVNILVEAILGALLEVEAILGLVDDITLGALLIVGTTLGPLLEDCIILGLLLVVEGLIDGFDILVEVYKTVG